jgi:hypothetical protein
MSDDRSELIESAHRLEHLARRAFETWAKAEGLTPGKDTWWETLQPVTRAAWLAAVIDLVAHLNTVR